MIGCDLCSPVVINAGRPPVITLLQRVVNGKGQIQTLTKSTEKVIIDFGCKIENFAHQILVHVRYGVVEGL